MREKMKFECRMGRRMYWDDISIRRKIGKKRSYKGKPKKLRKIFVIAEHCTHSIELHTMKNNYYFLTKRQMKFLNIAGKHSKINDKIWLIDEEINTKIYDYLHLYSIPRIYRINKMCIFYTK